MANFCYDLEADKLQSSGDSKNFYCWLGINLT